MHQTKNKHLAKIMKDATDAGIQTNSISESMQVDGIGMRALADEMKVRISRTNAGRNASLRSAAETSTGY